MSHTSAKRWDYIEQRVGLYCAAMVKNLAEAEEAYQQFQEIYVYAGATDQGMADLLFQDVNNITDGNIADTATSEQVAMVNDAKEAMIALHQLWQTANNVAMNAQDRMTDLRRMI